MASTFPVKHVAKHASKAASGNPHKPMFGKNHMTGQKGPARLPASGTKPRGVVGAPGGKVAKGGAKMGGAK